MTPAEREKMLDQVLYDYRESLLLPSEDRNLTYTENMFTLAITMATATPFYMYYIHRYA